MRQWIQKPPLGVQINWTNPPSNNFVAYWPMQEGYGNRIYDISGNDNTGIFYGDTKWVAGKFGSCLSFDGGGDYVDFGNLTKFNYSPTMMLSWSFWYCMSETSPTKSHTIIAKMASSGAYPGWVIAIQGNIANDPFYVCFQTHYQSDTIERKFTRPNDTNWHHVVFTYDGTGVSSGISLYCDGIPAMVVYEGSVSWVNPINIITSLMFAQYGAASTYDLNGKLDNVMTFNRALTGAEIQQLYREPFCMFNKKFIGKI